MQVSQSKVHFVRRLEVFPAGLHIYGGLEVQNKSQFWKQNNKLQTQMQI